VQPSPFEHQLEDRLTLIESGDGDPITVPDLPLVDFLVAVAVLAVVIVGMVWWAY
jgi:hypothetical protein